MGAWTFSLRGALSSIGSFVGLVRLLPSHCKRVLRRKDREGGVPGSKTGAGGPPGSRWIGHEMVQWLGCHPSSGVAYAKCEA